MGALAQGVTVGVGVFTTICLDAGQPILWSWHLERLRADACVIGLPLPPNDELENGLLELVRRNRLTEVTARGRITVLATAPAEPPVVVISAQKEELRTGRAKLVTTEYRLNESSPLTGVKSTSYAANLMILQEATKAGADEALMFNGRGELCEGASSNIFLVNGNKLLTPSLSSGCLPGVIRRWVLQWAPELGLEVCEGVLSDVDLAAAQEVFLTSSLRGVQLVGEIDGRGLALDMPWADKLCALYQACRKDGIWL